MTDDNKKPEPDQADLLPADLAAEADALLAEELPEAGAAPATPGEAPAPETAEMLAAFLDVTFNGLIAPKRGTHWQLDKAECATLGQAYGAVIEKYFPSMDIGCEFTAVVVTVAIVAPRIAEDARLRAEAADQGAPAGEGDDIDQDADA